MQQAKRYLVSGHHQKQYVSADIFILQLAAVCTEHQDIYKIKQYMHWLGL